MKQVTTQVFSLKTEDQGLKAGSLSTWLVTGAVWIRCQYQHKVQGFPMRIDELADCAREA